MTRRARELVESRGETRGDVVLHCDPREADVAVDGIPQGTCRDFEGKPRGLTLGPGLHRIDVTAPGRVPYTTSYEASGVRAAFRVELREAARSP